MDQCAAWIMSSLIGLAAVEDEDMFIPDVPMVGYGPAGCVTKQSSCWAVITGGAKMDNLDTWAESLPSKRLNLGRCRRVGFGLEAVSSPIMQGSNPLHESGDLSSHRAVGIISHQGFCRRTQKGYSGGIHERAPTKLVELETAPNTPPCILIILTA